MSHCQDFGHFSVERPCVQPVWSVFPWSWCLFISWCSAVMKSVVCRHFACLYCILPCIVSWTGCIYLSSMHGPDKLFYEPCSRLSVFDVVRVLRKASTFFSQSVQCVLSIILCNNISKATSLLMAAGFKSRSLLHIMVLSKCTLLCFHLGVIFRIKQWAHHLRSLILTYVSDLLFRSGRCRPSLLSPSEIVSLP